MLFAAIYTARNPTEDSERRSLQLFASWQPPFEFKYHWSRADGRGGISIFEADDAAVVLEGVAPFSAFFDFDVVPIVDIEQAVPIFMQTNEWAASVS